MNIKKIISIFLGLVAIVMIGFGVYIMNSSKYIFETALDNVFSFLTDKYVETEVLNYDKFKLTTNNKVTMSSMELANMDGDIYADIPNLSFYVDFDSSIMNEDYIALQGLLKDEKVYFKVKEVLDKFYYEEIEIPSELKEIDYKQIKLSESEVELLFTYLKDSILKDLSNKDFDKHGETIAIENQNYKTTKIGLKVTEKRLVKIIENFLTSIVNDNKAIQAIQKLDKTITKGDIQELLEVFKENGDNVTNDEMFTFAFYIEGVSSLKRVELTSPAGDTDSYASKSGIKLDLFENSYKNETYIVSIYEGETTELTFKLEYISNTKANILLNADDIKVEGTIDSTDKTQNIKLSLVSEGKNLGTLDYTYTIVQKDKEYKMDVIIDVSSMFIITSNNTLLLNEEMPNIETKDALPIDDMSEEEKEELEEYFDDKSNILNSFETDNEE